MDKKELKQAYKQYRPDMGVFAFRCKATGRHYIGYGQNLKGDINSITFRLKFGNYSSTKSNLQSEWSKHGEANFEVVILEQLEYDKDESKTDYQADLRILREFCSEKLTDFEFIQD